MCGRFTQAFSWSELYECLHIPGPAQNLEARYNVCPTQQVAAVRIEDGERRLVRLRWGLIPPWARDERIGSQIVNARAETIDKIPPFREAFQQRRCLIPADGFYEWTGPKSDKQPWRIAPKDGGIFAFAGLWETWQRRGEALETCTIITCEANELVAELHNRMPVILPPEADDAWIGGSAGTEVLKPFPADRMIAWPVDKRVGNVRNDDPGLVKPVA